MDAAFQGTVAGDGLRLAYRVWGDEGSRALPLVLLHGLTGHGQDWGRVATILAQRRHVIALDARGHGASDWSTDAAYAGDAHFADVATALDALGVHRCALAGYSMGGGVAILTAGALPERVQRLIVVDAYPAPEMTEGSRRIAEIVAATAATGGLRIADCGPAGEPSTDTTDTAGSDVRRDGVCSPLRAAIGNRQSAITFDPAIARKIAEELASGEARRLDLWPLWEAVCCPALVVRGALSDVLPAPLADEMIARQGNARLAMVPGVGHQIPFAAPETLAALIEDFLNGAD